MCEYCFWKTDIYHEIWNYKRYDYVQNHCSDVKLEVFWLWWTIFGSMSSTTFMANMLK